MTQSVRLLHLEDDPRDAELIRLKLKAGGFRGAITWVNDKKAFESALAQMSFDAVLSDYDLKLPDYDGMSALNRVRETQPDLPVIVISGTLGEEAAVECLQAGAYDYVLKQRPLRLATAVTRAISETRERMALRQSERELAETRNRLQNIVSSLSDVVWSYSLRDKRLLYVNAVVDEVFGRPAAEFYATPGLWRETVHPDDRVRVRAEREAGLAVGRFESVYRVVLPDGGVHWIQDRVRVVCDGNGRPLQLDGVARDITGGKRQEARIARLSRIHAVLSGINSAIVRVRDRQKLFEEACRIAVEHGGFGIAWIGLLDSKSLEIVPAVCAGVEADSFLATSPISARPDSPLGQSIVGRAVREKRAVLCNDITAEPAQGGPCRREALRRGYRSLIAFPLLVEDQVVGSLSLFAKELNFFDDEEIKLLTAMVDDISFVLGHIAKEERLNYLAYYDVLTALPNRALFHDRANQLLRAAQKQGGGKKVALVLLDLERFRAVNETFGRGAGDSVLRQVAGRLAAGRLGPDHLARIGADVFAAVLGDLEKEEEAAHFVEKRGIGLLEPMVINGQELRLSAKAGIALFPADGADVDMLFRNAEAALKKAKLSGDRYLFYTAELNARTAERLTLENKLRRALERRELTLHYQPVVDLAKGSICALEALMRWSDPDLGSVSPVKFIAVMEETGLILDAGRWALEQSVADFRRWQADGVHPPRVAVNVSQIQLQQKDFVATVRRALGGAAGAAGVLGLEMTESLIMQDIEANIGKLKAVREMGVEVAIDDFGTGYSSLSYISKLPVNVLKIDRAFIVDLMRNPGDVGIVTTIISLAHSLNLKVVAEGVEAEEQAKLLRLLKCDRMQGYLFSPAVPAERIGQFLREKKSLPV